jgi:hypothetical protein
MGQDLPIVEASRSHSVTPNSVELLCSSDRPVAETLGKTKHSQEADIHTPGTQTGSLSKRAATDRVVSGIGFLQGRH